MRSPERRSEDGSSLDPRSWVSGRAHVTVLLTAILVSLLGGVSLVARVETRNSDGDRRDMRVIDIWREALQAIPAEVPSAFTQASVGVLLIAALIGIAYIIVAILRLPR